MERSMLGIGISDQGGLNDCLYFSESLTNGCYSYWLDKHEFWYLENVVGL
jgi:hypothetical protein